MSKKAHLPKKIVHMDISKTPSLPSVENRGHLADPLPPLLVHVDIEWPLISIIPPKIFTIIWQWTQSMLIFFAIFINEVLVQWLGHLLQQCHWSPVQPTFFKQ